MKLQDILDKIDNKFKGKAIDGDNNCLYLTNDGKKCAIGLFIPDGHKAQQDGSNVRSVLGDNPDLMKYMPFQDLDDLDALQMTHDNVEVTLSIDEQKEILKDAVRGLYRLA